MWSTKFVFFCQAGKHPKHSRNFDCIVTSSTKIRTHKQPAIGAFGAWLTFSLQYNVTLWCLQFLSLTVASHAWYCYLYYYSNHHPTHHTSYYQVFYYHHILIVCVTHTTTSFYIPNIFFFISWWSCGSAKAQNNHVNKII